MQFAVQFLAVLLKHFISYSQNEGKLLSSPNYWHFFFFLSNTAVIFKESACNNTLSEGLEHKIFKKYLSVKFMTS